MFKIIGFLFLLGKLYASSYSEGDGFVEPYSTPVGRSPVTDFLEVNNTFKDLQLSQKTSIESSDIVAQSTNDSHATENDYSSSQ